MLGEDRSAGAEGGAGRQHLFPAVAAALGLLALGVRLNYLREMAGHPAFTLLFSDSRSYDLWARRIAGGEWLGGEVFFQSPLYPYLLGVLYRLFGPDPLAVRVLQALLGASACVLLAFAGRRFFSAPAGIVAGALLALWPAAIFFDGLVQKASLDLFLVALLLLLFSRIREEAGPGWWLGTGAVLGALTLNRENAALLVLLPAIALAASRRSSGSRALVRRGGALLAGLGLLLLPVGLRNLAVGGEFLLTTSQLGPNLYIGNDPAGDGLFTPLVPGHDDPRYEREDATALAEAAAGRTLTPGEVSRYWTRRTVSAVLGQPVAWLRLLGVKFLLAVNKLEIADAYDQASFGRWSRTLGALNPLLHWGVLVPLAVLEIGCAWPRRRELLLVHGFVLLYGAGLILFSIFSRYRHPLTPALILFAAAGLTGLPGLRRRPPAPGKVLAVALGVAATAVVSNLPRPDLAVAGRATMYRNIGVALHKSGGAYREAVPYLAEAMALQPDQETGMFHARALLMLGSHDAALARAREAAALKDDETAVAKFGRTLEGFGRTADAIDFYTGVLRQYPSQAETNRLLAAALRRLGRAGEPLP
jgi:4-amino-4-deoxy-L-arabinose transferase-like glycosyltransferase